MTNREFFNAIINSNINADLVAHAKAELEKLDAKNEKRKNTLTKTQKENESLKVEVLNYIKEKGSAVASEIGSALSISTQKASSLCTLLKNDGLLTVSDLKVKGKGSVKQYTAVEVDEDEVSED